MSREVPFDKEAECDVCGATGAYDFMGDYTCADCAGPSGATHDELWGVCHVHGLKWKGWVEETEGADCSSGCKWYHLLEGKRGMDWGVCFNPKSRRSGLLTFEHMGCEHFDFDNPDTP